MNREKLKEAIVEKLDEMLNRLPKGKEGVIDVNVVLTHVDKSEETKIYEVNAEFVEMADKTWELESIDCHMVA
ncbi:hypothetical protein KAT92_06185 [Candidatus Babeliales bacterium]|nr:hypothetical protein [Candidatus Babeliales bacterium]